MMIHEIVVISDDFLGGLSGGFRGSVSILSFASGWARLSRNPVDSSLGVNDAVEVLSVRLLHTAEIFFNRNECRGAHN